MFASGFIVRKFDSTRPGSFSCGWGHVAWAWLDWGADAGCGIRVWAENVLLLSGFCFMYVDAWIV